MQLSLHARRRAAAYLRAKRLVSKLFKDLAARFTERKGGYTRIIKLGRRVGDGAELAIIELLGNPREAAADEASKKRAKGGSKKKAAESKAAAEASDDSEIEE